jgi:hypothetical protein
MTETLIEWWRRKKERERREEEERRRHREDQERSHRDSTLTTTSGSLPSYVVVGIVGGMLLSLQAETGEHEEPKSYESDPTIPERRSSIFARGSEGSSRRRRDRRGYHAQIRLWLPGAGQGDRRTSPVPPDQGDGVAVMRFYPVQARWRRIKPHLSDPELLRIMTRDMSKFRPTFRAGMLPVEADGCDWRFHDHEGNLRRGRMPAYWDWVCHSACHWMVSWALRLAERVEPATLWRIVSSQAHSTVWSGTDVLFDLQFSALGVDPDEAWELASKGGRVLRVGREKLCCVVVREAA